MCDVEWNRFSLNIFSLFLECNYFWYLVVWAREEAAAGVAGVGAHRLLPALAVLVHGEREHGELGTVERLGCIVAKY